MPELIKWQKSKLPVNQRLSFALAVFPVPPSFLSFLYRRLPISLLPIRESLDMLGMVIGYQIWNWTEGFGMLCTWGEGFFWLRKVWSRSGIVNNMLRSAL